MNFLSYEEVAQRFRGKSVAIIGSGPSCLKNDGRFIDRHDIVVRVNNFKTQGFEDKTGKRTDVHYSFYGSSVRKKPRELYKQGVRLCMSKCPNSKFIESGWHERNGRQIGTDFRYIYEMRRSWWFCDTYIPTTERFLSYFHLLNDHIPTTGFACILDIASFDCDIYVTGFDFFESKVHNVNERWRPGRKDDPFRHSPEEEIRWLNQNRHRFTLDKTLSRILRHEVR